MKMEGLLSVLKSSMIRSAAQIIQFSKIWERENKLFLLFGLYGNYVNVKNVKLRSIHF